MIKRPKVPLIILSAASTTAILASCLFLFAVLTGSAQAETPDNIGRSVYEKGVGQGGKAIKVLIGESRLEADARLFPCVNCHGSDGGGTREGGVTAPDITWNVLSRPYGAAYDEGLFTRAVTRGIASSGRPLDATMPRYRLTRDEGISLIGWLKTIDETTVPGVDAGQIRFGVILPDSIKGTREDAAISDAVRNFLEAYFGEINQSGGIYNRKIKLIYGTYSTLSHRQPLAIIESPNMTFSEPVAIATDKPDAIAVDVPIIRAFAKPRQSATTMERPQTFSLYSGVKGQAETLVRFAKERLNSSAPPHSKKASSVIVAYAKPWGTVATSLGIPAVSIERSEGWPRPNRPNGIIVLADAKTTSDFIRILQRAPKTPSLLVPVSLYGPSIRRRKLFQGYPGKVYGAFPPGPESVSASGKKHILDLALKRTLAKPQRTTYEALLKTLAMAELVTRVTQKSGASPSRQKLIDQLERLYGFPSGWGPPLTFGPNRRVGARGAFVKEITTR